MNEKNEDPWLIIDDPMEDIIVGNRRGLEELSNAINDALNNKEVNFNNYVKDTSVVNVILSSKNVYLDSIPEYKESFNDKLISGFLAIWFLFLPFVALALIAWLTVS